MIADPSLDLVHAAGFAPELLIVDGLFSSAIRVDEEVGGRAPLTGVPINSGTA
jgi:hypothetical protein